MLGECSLLCRVAKGSNLRCLACGGLRVACLTANASFHNAQLLTTRSEPTNERFRTHPTSIRRRQSQTSRTHLVFFRNDKLSPAGTPSIVIQSVAREKIITNIMIIHNETIRKVALQRVTTNQIRICTIDKLIAKLRVLDNV